MKKFYRFINIKIDWFNNTIQKESISRYHIFLMFAGLGLYLVILPLLNLIHVSLSTELYLGNYTNIVSAGVSLLTLAEAVRIGKRQSEKDKKLNSHAAAIVHLDKKVTEISQQANNDLKEPEF
jgi:hypothetical protein